MANQEQNAEGQRMAAVVSRAGGPVDGPESLIDAMVPVPAAPTGHDILVDVKAVSVNPVDVKTRASGNHRGTNGILGWDAAGTVLAIGEDVTLFQPGDHVFYAGAFERQRSYASMPLVDERIVGPKPSALSFAEAAALPLTTITAWEALFDKLKLTEASTGTLLVVGAAGGVGSILIQLAKVLTGVHVIATASRPESREWVESLGADRVVDHTREDVADQILEGSPGGVDFIFSSQSRGKTDLFSAVIRPFGEIVAIDDGSDIDLMGFKGKAVSWHWELMFTRPRYGFQLLSQHRLLSRVAELIDNGRIRTTVTKTLTPIDAAQLRDAHRQVETGGVIGKIVVAGQE